VFELRNEQHESNELTKSYEEVEQPNPTISRFEKVRKLAKRYSPLDFHVAFVLFATVEETKLVKGVVYSIEGKL
jgi:hypothetical protein